VFVGQFARAFSPKTSRGELAARSARVMHGDVGVLRELEQLLGVVRGQQGARCG
jgi:hypothetical protein